MFNLANLSLSFSPLVPWSWLIGLGACAVVMLLLGLATRVSGGVLRGLTFAAILVVLANPSILQEEREDLNDVVLLMVDESSSLVLRDRQQQIELLQTQLGDKLAKIENKDVRVYRFSDAPDGNLNLADVGGTKFKKVLDTALSEAPLNRLAAVIVLSDGQVHDLPTATDENQQVVLDLGLPKNTPLHLVLAGEPNEVDRVLSIVAAPKFGVVGETVFARIRVQDLGVDVPTRARVSILRNGRLVARVPVNAGRTLKLAIPVEIAGQNLFEVRVEKLDPKFGEELSQSNNTSLISVNGVRERLKVLLVSGQPHQGERAWRNLLKSDPSVDLVHFTILRPADKRDNTPINELSLVPFPVRQLFVEKLYDFDLVIFDQYPRRGILPPVYFNHMANYVNKGGAMFVGTGPNFATTKTIYATALSSILPGRPDGIVHEKKFKPQVSELGLRHPITSQMLPPATVDEDGVLNLAEPNWGSWMRHINVRTNRGQVLMTGVNEAPLLITHRAGKGRVVQLASDNLWLWSRGFEGGGPDAELLRRSVHWLMGEPELEEENLKATHANGRMKIERRSLGLGDVTLEIESPSGQKTQTKLLDNFDGRALGDVKTLEQGIYILRDGKMETRVAVGDLNPKELSDLRSTTDVFAPFVDFTKGYMGRGKPFAEKLEAPDLRAVSAGRKTAGSDWMGIVSHGATRLLGLKSLSLTPALLALLLIGGLLLWGWRRESA